MGAFYLARVGLRVAVFERRHVLGGACEELFDGYRLSSRAYVCWMLQPAVIEDMRLERNGFSYAELDPLSFNPCLDGSHLFSWRTTRGRQAAIARLSRHDADAFPAWSCGAARRA